MDALPAGRSGSRMAGEQLLGEVVVACAGWRPRNQLHVPSIERMHDQQGARA